MTAKETEQRYIKICDHIFNRRLKPALDELTQFIRFNPKTDYHYQTDILSDNYQTLLRYAFEGYRDPQQSSMLNSLCSSILSIADEVRAKLSERDHPFRLLEKSNHLTGGGEDVGSDIYPWKNPETVFRQIWLIEKIHPQHITLIQSINRSDHIEWHEKCLVVTALTLSLANYFDPQKVILLTEFIEEHQDQVYQRALTGIIITLMMYDKRIRFYPEIIKRLESIQETEHIRDDAELILMQLLQAKETERIAREFEEEVLPDMKKMMPRIEDKLQLGEIGEEDDPEELNPKWKGLVDEVPGLLEKIEKFSKMQMEGADVFMSTFQLLKRFDFFNRMSNWFVPFHRDHPEIKQSFNGQEDINLRLIESLEKAFYICNSDKYSFALNFQAIPAQQRSMIIANFEAEFAQMKEMASEEQLLDQTLQSNAVFIQYIQDLYRFFKLFPNRTEFEDVFQLKVQFDELNFYKQFFIKPGFPEKLAGFYFEKEHYFNAIRVYETLVLNPPPRGEYYEKIAYSYQMLGRYKKAIEYYKMAELFDPDRIWILRKLAWCNLKLKDYGEALRFYKEAADLQPDDIHLSNQIAQCCLNLKDYEQALKYYSKVIFFNPENIKILRPVAYCHFLMGRLEQAEESYEKLLAKIGSPSAFDLLNAGHVQLCLGNRKKALEYYKKSLENLSLSQGDLMSAFDEDIPYLLANGIREDEIPLIKDFILYQRNPL